MLESVRIINKSKNPNPSFGTLGSSFNIQASIGAILMPGEIQIIDTGLFIEVPAGYELHLRTKISLACKGVTIVNAPSYIEYGNLEMVRVILRNNNREDSINNTFKISPGDDIASCVFVKVEKPSFINVKSFK